MSRPDKSKAPPQIAEHARPEGLEPGPDEAAEPQIAEHEIATELAGAAPETPELLDENEALGPLSEGRLRSVLESYLFASDRPLTAQRVLELLEETASPPSRSGERSGPPLYQPAQINAALESLSAEYRSEGRGIELHNVAGAWQLRTAPQNAPWVQRLLQAKPVRLSRAQLETLSIVAYRQPITRPEIDDIRGVDSGGSLKTLLERQMVRVLGKKEEPGRPLLYGTTREFLEFFNLRDLKDLPTLREYYDLTDESKEKVRAAHGDEAIQMPLGTAGPPDVPPPPAAPGAGPAAPTDATPAAASPPAETGHAPGATGTTGTHGTPEAAPAPPLPTRELIDQQLADDAEQLAKIDELIRAVNTDFALMDLGAIDATKPVPGAAPGAGSTGPTAAAPATGSAAADGIDEFDEPEPDADSTASSLRDDDEREPEEL